MQKIGTGPVSCPTVLNEIINYVNDLNPSLIADSQTQMDELNIPQYRELVNYCLNKFDLDSNALDDFDVSFSNLSDLATYIAKLNPSTEIL
jgi:hypothetical protein